MGFFDDKERWGDQNRWAEWRIAWNCAIGDLKWADVDYEDVFTRNLLEGVALAALKQICIEQQMGWHEFLDAYEHPPGHFKFRGDKGHKLAAGRIRIALSDYSRTYGYNGEIESGKPQRMSEAGFLREMRHVKKKERDAEILRQRLQAMKDAEEAPPDERYVIVTGDCRKITREQWGRVNLIATDPPWEEIELYRWLGQWAMEILPKGGLLLTQCNHWGMPDVLDVLREAGLSYVWQLSINYAWGKDANGEHLGVRVCTPFMVSHRPVLVFSKGKWAKKNLPHFSDTYTSKDQIKQVHKWQQSLPAWEYWLSKLTKPGWRIADPFAGSGTNGVAVKRLGEKRQFVGCEKDERHAQVARGVLAKTVEGAYWTEQDSKTFGLDPALGKAVADYCKETGKSVNHLVAAAVRAFLNVDAEPEPKPRKARRKDRQPREDLGAEGLEACMPSEGGRLFDPSSK